jgi:hypothetical protein
MTAVGRELAFPRVHNILKLIMLHAPRLYRAAGRAGGGGRTPRRRPGQRAAAAGAQQRRPPDAPQVR